MQGLKVNFESEFDIKVLKNLAQKGHEALTGHYFEFGGVQIIFKLEDGYLAASDPRKDGQAVGF